MIGFVYLEAILQPVFERKRLLFQRFLGIRGAVSKEEISHSVSATPPYALARTGYEHT